MPLPAELVFARAARWLLCICYFHAACAKVLLHRGSTRQSLFCNGLVGQLQLLITRVDH